MITTPVAFIISHRPELTRLVFKQIVEAKPRKLFIIADGPRIPEYAEKCRQARAVVNGVDWDCEVLTNFSDVNLGAGKRVATGLDWVFSNVEEAIILEDDCLPAPSFFNFCQELLGYYRNDERIMHIGCNNFQRGIKRTEDSYFFSKYNHVWGWATWKRAWKYYDFDMKTWPEVRETGNLNFPWESRFERKYFTDIFESSFNHEMDAWDYQWTYSLWRQGGLSIYPSVNLVSNIGFGPDGVHCKDPSNWRASLPAEDIRKIKHPPSVIRDIKADRYTFDHLFNGRDMKERGSIKRKVKSLLKSIINYPT